MRSLSLWVALHTAIHDRQPLPLQVKRADAIRAFILSHYGGLYLDLDNECYRPAEEAFKDYDIVLQGTGFEGVNNGMMASVPGHPLWTRWEIGLQTSAK